MERAEKFAEGEEVDKKKMGLFEKKAGKQLKEEGKKGDKNKGPVFSRLNFINKGRLEPKIQDNQLTPLTKTRIEVLAIVAGKGVLRSPLPMITPNHKRSRDNCCRFHKQHGHDIENYSDLKKEIEEAIRQGYLQEFVHEARRRSYESSNRSD